MICLLKVEAFDLDQAGTKNSEIRYEIIHGNYDKKFHIDSFTGQVSVMEPLTLDLIRQSRQAALAPSKVQRISSNIEPVISLTVRAYDLGIPSLDSEVLVHIFTEQTTSRTMQFIVYEDADVLNKNKADVSDLISAMTGGQAEIQDIQPYALMEIDRMDYLEIDYTDRDGKDYENDETERVRRSLVDVLIRYPTNTSIVDMNDITAKLVREVNPVSTEGTTTGTTEDPTVMEELKYKNAALFWGLIALLILIALVLIVALLCFCCPKCYLYKKE